MRFGCAVNRFCSSRAKKKHWKNMIFNHPNHLRKTSTHPVFSLLEVSVPECFWQRSGHRLQQGDIITPCPAVSPSAPFFPTCQVRVVRFYQSCSSPPRLALLLLLLLLLFLLLLLLLLLDHVCINFHLNFRLANSSPSSLLSAHRWTSTAR